MSLDNGMMSTVLMLVAMVAVFYFLLIRPAQKKQKDQQNLINALEPGARIMTTAGLFGTIRHIGTKQAIVEIAPGLEMTVLKQAIMRVVDPSEEEFEYDDAETGADAVPPAAAEGFEPEFGDATSAPAATRPLTDEGTESVAAEDAVLDDTTPEPRRDDTTGTR